MGQPVVFQVPPKLGKVKSKQVSKGEIFSDTKKKSNYLALEALFVVMCLYQFRSESNVAAVKTAHHYVQQGVGLCYGSIKLNKIFCCSFQNRMTMHCLALPK